MFMLKGALGVQRKICKVIMLCVLKLDMYVMCKKAWYS